MPDPRTDDLSSIRPLRPLRVLAVDDEPTIRRTLSLFLESEGHTVRVAADVRAALDAARREPFDLVFLDLRLGTTSGLDLLPDLMATSPWLSVVMITAHGTIETAVEAMRRGAAEYLTKPFTPDQVRAAVDRVVRLRDLEQRVAALEPSTDDADRPAAWLAETTSPDMRQAVRLAEQVAASDASVLLCGESGTGKGLVASFVHRLSARADRPFVTVAAPSLSAGLAESELFGHARGAFTGAVRDHAGKVAAAQGGTLFLDEIGDLPLELQPKLLRFLQDRTYERVGETTVRRGDVRLVCATNVDLPAAVAAGRFRQDLLYRINVVQIDLPPLRDRPDDVLPTAGRLLATLRGSRPLRGFTDAAADALRRYGWPGNVRELRNVVERATVVCPGPLVDVPHLPPGLRPTGAAAAATPVRLGDAVPLDRIEAEHLRLLLARSPSLEAAADALGVDVTTLWRKRRRYGL